jgi:hypothetical protein
LIPRGHVGSEISTIVALLDDELSGCLDVVAV